MLCVLFWFVSLQHAMFICSGTYGSLFVLGKMSSSKISLAFSLSFGV